MASSPDVPYSPLKQLMRTLQSFVQVVALKCLQINLTSYHKHFLSECFSTNSWHDIYVICEVAGGILVFISYVCIFPIFSWFELKRVVSCMAALGGLLGAGASPDGNYTKRKYCTTIFRGKHLIKGAVTWRGKRLTQKEGKDLWEVVYFKLS